jgi:hypothetical protein
MFQVKGQLMRCRTWSEKVQRQIHFITEFFTVSSLTYSQDKHVETFYKRKNMVEMCCIFNMAALICFLGKLGNKQRACLKNEKNKGDNHGYRPRARSHFSGKKIFGDLTSRNHL